MRVPDVIRRCVVYVGYMGGDGGAQRGATGFFVGVPLTGFPGIHLPYLVTAQHVVERCATLSTDGKIYVSFNLEGGGSAWEPTDLSSWLIPQDGEASDVAVCPWTTTAKDVTIVHFPLEGIMTQALLKGAGDIGPGDEVFLAGLFTRHGGKTMDLPIIRLGTIAALPEDPITTASGTEIEAYLIETRSVGGLSGSPVFIRPGPRYLELPSRPAPLPGPPNSAIEKDWTLLSGSPKIYLLAVMHGHWDLDTDPLVGGDGKLSQSVNIGVGIATPIERILPLLNDEREVERRASIERRIRAGRRPVADLGQRGATIAAPEPQRARQVHAHLLARRGASVQA